MLPRLSSKIRIIIAISFTLVTFRCYSAEPGGVEIIDAGHYSHVLGEMRNYRIFLPPGYDQGNPENRYPVIYFLHGWDQRYFGSGVRDYGSYDSGDDNQGDNIANFVSAHDVIVVKSDGYDRYQGEEYDRRPYNIGAKSQMSSHRQFPVYYPELITYIDANYHTRADREHRAISGLSMGGFMSWWIAGKYPHLFSAAGNFCGSPEFPVGPRDNPVVYRHLDMYNNYGGMKLYLHYGDQDFIRGYHKDVNRLWMQVLENYECRVYPGEHTTCGLGQMFASFMDVFRDPPDSPAQWNHIDVYPAFTVWDYSISTDRDIPGFTILENVSKRGFRCSVREFLPDGQLLPSANISVTTAPVYEKNAVYIINDLNLSTSELIQKEIRSDKEGKLKIHTDGWLHEIGINEPGAQASLVIASFEIDGAGGALPGEETGLLLRILNKGLSPAKDVTVTISPTKKGAEILKGEVHYPDVEANESAVNRVPFTFRVLSDSIEIVQLEVRIKEGRHSFEPLQIEIPVKREVPAITEFMIADGKEVTVASAGVKPETRILGNGNGDGKANPGESIVVLAKDCSMWRRVNVSFSDKYLNPYGNNQRDEDNWSAFDHVGSSFKYTVPLISSDCPQDHKIEMQGEYWLPDYPLHIIREGVFTINVKGQDSTPPRLRWLKIAGDNAVSARLWDGAEIESAHATFILKKDPSECFDVELNDEGRDGDRVKGDRVFSMKIPYRKFGLYHVTVEATDSYGNKMKYESPDTHVLH